MATRRFVSIVYLIGLAVLLLTACQPVHPVADQASAAQSSDTQTMDVAKQFLDAIVAKDIDAVAATLADDVTHRDTHAPPGVASITSGQENVTAYYQGNLGAPGYQMEYANLVADGDMVTWTAKESLDVSIVPPNFPLPIESHYSALVEDGMIKSILLDNDAEWLAKLYAAIPQEAIDPVSVTQIWLKAFNERDEETLRQFMADDIAFKIVYGLPDDPDLSGEVEVFTLIQGVTADNFTLELGSVDSDGTTVYGSYSGTGDDIRSLDIGPEVGMIEVVVENGMIKRMSFTPGEEFNMKYDEAKAKS